MLAPAFSYRSALRQGKWLLCLSIALLALCLTLLPQELLRYERQVVFAQGWRWLTAHLAHLSLSHLAFNLAGLALVCELFWQRLSLAHGVAVMLFAACVINLTLWFWHPEVQWYAGLSGLVHALWAACVSATLLRLHAEQRNSSQTLAVIGAALLLAKLIGESVDIRLTPLGAADFPVIEAVHAYGAGAGLAYVLLWRQGWSLSGRK